MTSPIAIKYPLDLTGISPNNLVVNEPQSLLNNTNRAFVPNYGPFYTAGLILVDVANGLPLVRNTQFVAAQLHQDLTNETGQEVCQVLVIKDPSVSNNILLTYQVVGGEYAYSVDALIQFLNALTIDYRTVTWDQLLGKPSAFVPTQHLHDIGDTYGWEYIVDSLNQLMQAILTGDDTARQNLIAYINNAVASMNTTVSGFNSLLTAHTGNLNNPHTTTKAQVGLGNVQNYGIAAQADVAAGTNNALYVTPYAIAGISSTLNAGLAAHESNFANPHNTTAAQVGLGNVQNYGMATNNDATGGTSTMLYMSPGTTAAAITALAYAPLNTALNTHIANHGNPHAVTAAQVGLGNVPNVGYASVAEAQTGTGNNLISGALVSTAITTLALGPLNAHISNYNNPHNTTAAQVGSYTTTQVDSTVSGLQTQINGKQNTLGFTPVQQSGGSGMSANKIYLGWDGSSILAQVDATPLGRISFAGSGGYVTNGTFQESFAATGYVKFPDGFILNWGAYIPTIRWSEGSIGTLGFALAFPHACLGVINGKINYDPNNIGNVTLYDDDARTYNVTTAQFSFYINWPGGGTNGDNWPGMTWLAWGY